MTAKRTTAKKPAAKKKRKASKNLKPQAHILTVEEQSKGGKRSVEVRRERKQLKQELIDLLSVGDVQTRISTALIKKAMAGDVKAFCVIRDTIGESPENVLPETPEVMIIDDI